MAELRLTICHGNYRHHFIDAVTEEEAKAIFASLRAQGRTPVRSKLLFSGGSAAGGQQVRLPGKPARSPAAEPPENDQVEVRL